MTAVLCECAFIDNAKDKKIIDTVAEQKKFGVAYAKAILEYLGIDYKETSTTTTTKTTKYVVQTGTYNSKVNAEAALKKVKSVGFTDAFIKTV